MAQVFLIQILLVQAFLTLISLTANNHGRKKPGKYPKLINIIFLLDIYFIIDKFAKFISKDTDV